MFNETDARRWGRWVNIGCALAVVLLVAIGFTIGWFIWGG